MSKLAKAINATFTGDVVASRSIGFEHTDLDLGMSSAPYCRIYDVQAKFGFRRIVEPSPTTRDNVSSETLRDLKRAVIEEIFGEFRPYLIQMRAAIYSQDNTRLRTLLAELEQQMFYEDL